MLASKLATIGGIAECVVMPHIGMNQGIFRKKIKRSGALRRGVVLSLMILNRLFNFYSFTFSMLS